MSRPRILVSNDDGVRSPGLLALAEAARELGEVTVVAPDREQSGASHAISLYRPLRLTRVGEDVWACDGTPTDSVYLGIHHVLGGRRPDLVLSGVNLGPNLAEDVSYSGTLAAAFEGSVFGVPSVALSLAGGPPWDFSHAARFAARLGARILETGLPPGIILNVNVPPGTPEGFRFTQQGRRGYGEAVQVRTDPRGRPYYWIGGDSKDHTDVPGSDCNALLDEGLISVTPLHLDLTAHAAMKRLEDWTLEGFSRVDPAE